MHEQKIIDEILSRLNADNCDVKAVSLICSEENLIKRLEKDIRTGIRKPDIIERSIARIPLYGSLKTHKIDTSDKTVDEIANKIIRI